MNMYIIMNAAQVPHKHASHDLTLGQVNICMWLKLHKISAKTKITTEKINPRVNFSFLSYDHKFIFKDLNVVFKTQNRTFLVLYQQKIITDAW